MYFTIFPTVHSNCPLALSSCTPIYQGASEKFVREYLTTTEEEKDRKYMFNLKANPRTSKAIQQTIDEKKQLISER